MTAALTSEAAGHLLAKYWSDDFLFDPVNELFREKVSPAGATTLPLLPCVAFLRFANAPDDAAAVAALCEAASTSPLVEVLREAGGSHSTTNCSGSGVWSLRRRHALRAEDDPSRRTVAVFPVPRDATAAEVADFFRPHATVERATRLSAPSAPNNGGHAFAAFAVRLATVEMAAEVLAMPWSYGAAASPLAQHFLPPKLHVTSLAAYMGRQAAQAARRGEAQLQANTLRAQRTLAAAQDGGVARFLRPGATLIADALAAGTGWRDLKARLGDFAAAAGGATLRHAITLVQMDEAPAVGKPQAAKSHSGSGGQRAFVVCRDAAAAAELRGRFQLAEHTMSVELQNMCGVLRQPTEEEEAYARQRFPEWCERRVESKQASNRKRERR